jgi:pyruvate formate lyase activating enzyme
MNCAWCHNPETISSAIDYIIDENKCIHCGKCDDGCYSGAKRLVGRKMNVSGVLDEVLLDVPYYGAEGGLTVTGGEPLMQPEFCSALFEEAGSRGVHCAVESNLYVDFETAENVYQLCDLLMFDIKIFNPVLHEQWTGVSNHKILINLKTADTLNIPMLIRTPIIPGINDNPDEIGAIAAYVSTLKNVYGYELLPYHALGLSKKLMNKPSRPEFAVPSREKMTELARVAAQFNVNVIVSSITFRESEVLC